MKDYASEKQKPSGRLRTVWEIANLHHPLIMHVPKAQKRCKTLNKSETRICI
jgi:hypothetical protein